MIRKIEINSLQILKCFNNQFIIYFNILIHNSQ